MTLSKAIHYTDFVSGLACSLLYWGALHYFLAVVGRKMDCCENVYPLFSYMQLQNSRSFSQKDLIR